jgi:hypothetical protein
MTALSISSSEPNSSPPKDEKMTSDPTKLTEVPTSDVEFGESQEVFRENVEGVEFRTVSWQRAAVVFLKINFAMSILSIPGALAALGSVGGSLCIVFYTSLNVCKLRQSNLLQRNQLIVYFADTAIVLGDFRNNHPGCHSKCCFPLIDFGNI